MGHVPARSLRGLGPRGDLQGRQRGGAAGEGALSRDPRRATGARGEEAVASWYEARGFEVLARNWSCREGELDLVVRNGRLYVFCEVKTRATDAFGVPAESVTRQKQMRLRRLAARWLDDAPLRPRQIRFDVASVLGGEIEVLEGAF